MGGGVHFDESGAECDVAKSKRGAVTCGMGGVAIFAWSAEEEESHVREIGHGQGQRCAVRQCIPCGGSYLAACQWTPGWP
jgi:hypothetical protein